MLTFILNPDHEIPLYQQLYSFIRKEIETGRLQPGEKLTSKRKLAAHLKISQNTVATAYEQLAAEGYIISKPKSGYYVAVLEDMLPDIPKNPPEAAVHSDEKPKREQWLYDFKTNTVDANFFPFPTWAKISREILHNRNRNLLRAVDPRGIIP